MNIGIGLLKWKSSPYVNRPSVYILKFETCKILVIFTLKDPQTVRNRTNAQNGLECHFSNHQIKPNSWKPCATSLHQLKKVLFEGHILPFTDQDPGLIKQ